MEDFKWVAYCETCNKLVSNRSYNFDARVYAEWDKKQHLAEHKDHKVISAFENDVQRMIEDRELQNTPMHPDVKVWYESPKKP